MAKPTYFNRVLKKKMAMDNIQSCDSYINILSSQTYTSNLIIFSTDEEREVCRKFRSGDLHNCTFLLRFLL
jgi:hypothetical protein